MCGILGIFSLNLPKSAVIKEALDSIKHRGPDDEGYVMIDCHTGESLENSGSNSSRIIKETQPDILHADTGNYNLVLANRRLSIIDTSATGHQPMSSSDRALWITYNGEIFNHRELRMELKANGYRFRSDSDTEVVLAAYAEWGIDCVNRFNGQWAFCIFDKRNRLLFCSRDRFGIKPFYYLFDGSSFAFASEIKALLKMPFAGRILNKSLVFELDVYFVSDYAEESIYKGIHQLMPSHNLILDLRELRMHTERYYEVPFPDEVGHYHDRRALTYADDIRYLLTEAVKMQLASDVPVGTCLSGGLDSSSIAVIVKKLLDSGEGEAGSAGDQQKTFTASFDDPSVDEKTFAEEVARHAQAESFYDFPSGENLWKEIEDFLFCHEGLCRSTNMYAGWSVMRLASKQVKVVLCGQGGDELFGGYFRYAHTYAADMIRGGQLQSLFNYLVQKAGLYGKKQCFDNFLMGVYLAVVPDPVKAFLFKQRNRKRFETIANILGEKTLLDEGFRRVTDRTKSLNYQLHCDLTQDYLPQLLHYDDKNASAFSIENRVPFLDHRLVEYVAAIPSIYKLYNGWSKWLLRLAMRDMLPERILWRRDKIGFQSPLKRWINEKNSPIPAIVNKYGIEKHGPEFAWHFYLALRLMGMYEKP